LVRHRLQLVRTAAMVKNRVHSLLDRYGLKHGFSDVFGKAGMEWLRGLELKPLDRLLLDSFIEQINALRGLLGMLMLRLVVGLLWMRMLGFCSA